MKTSIQWGAFALAPLGSALVVAFWTRSAAFSLLLGSAVGVVLLGSDPARDPNVSRPQKAWPSPPGEWG